MISEKGFSDSYSTMTLRLNMPWYQQGSSFFRSYSKSLILVSHFLAGLVFSGLLIDERTSQAGSVPQQRFPGMAAFELAYHDLPPTHQCKQR